MEICQTVQGGFWKVNKTQFLDGMNILSGAYLEERLTNENTLNVWYQFFKEIDNMVFDNAIKEIILENIKRPSISELHDKCVTVKKNLPKHEEPQEEQIEYDDEIWSDERWEEEFRKRGL